MEHLTIDQAIKHLHWMAESLEDMQKKYPDAKYRGGTIKFELRGIKRS